MIGSDGEEFNEYAFATALLALRNPSTLDTLNTDNASITSAEDHSEHEQDEEPPFSMEHKGMKHSHSFGKNLMETGTLSGATAHEPRKKKQRPRSKDLSNTISGDLSQYARMLTDLSADFHRTGLDSQQHGSSSSASATASAGLDTTAYTQPSALPKSESSQLLSNSVASLLMMQQSSSNSSARGTTSSSSTGDMTGYEESIPCTDMVSAAYASAAKAAMALHPPEPLLLSRQPAQQDQGHGAVYPDGEVLAGDGYYILHHGGVAQCVTHEGATAGFSMFPGRTAATTNAATATTASTSTSRGPRPVIGGKLSKNRVPTTANIGRAGPTKSTAAGACAVTSGVPNTCADKSAMQGDGNRVRTTSGESDCSYLSVPGWGMSGSGGRSRTTSAESVDSSGTSTVGEAEEGSLLANPGYFAAAYRLPFNNDFTHNNIYCADIKDTTTAAAAAAAVTAARIASFNHLSGSTPTTTSKKNSRGRYKCSRCGELKTNHTCSVFEDKIVCSIGTEMLRDPITRDLAFITLPATTATTTTDHANVSDRTAPLTSKTTSKESGGGSVTSGNASHRGKEFVSRFTERVVTVSGRASIMDPELKKSRNSTLSVPSHQKYLKHHQQQGQVASIHNGSSITRNTVVTHSPQHQSTTPSTATTTNAAASTSTPTGTNGALIRNLTSTSTSAAADTRAQNSSTDTAHHSSDFLYASASYAVSTTNK